MPPAWWHEREVDTAYLSHGPWLWFRRVRDEVTSAGPRGITLIEVRDHDREAFEVWLDAFTGKARPA
jgi:hypothetical protein